MIKNIITGVIAVVLAVVASLALVGNNQPKQNLSGNGTRFPNGISTDSTSPSDNEVRSTTLTVTGASTLTGTTTIARSVDGLVVGGSISTAATGTAITVYTNTNRKVCDASTGFVLARNNGSFSPSMRLSMGTSTASVTTTNLVASSTLATSTTKTIIPNDSLFIFESGDKLMAILDDNGNTTASSTYFSNWSAEAGMWCQDISI